MIRAYTYPHFANKGKVEKIRKVLKEYRKTARKLAKYQWSVFFKEGRFNKYAKIKHVESKLSERYKQVCLWQVVSTLEGFVSNIQNKFKQIVLSSSLDIKTKEFFCI